MDSQLRSKLLVLIDHVLLTEATHYEESGEPDNHVYTMALELKLALTLETT